MDGAKKSFPGKRKEGPAANQGKDTRSTGRSFKRVKFQDARNIRTQPSDAALDDGKLDLQKFLNTREFEIKALEASMHKCKTANATRVFQQVPRAMRRRTASHNVQRIPKRLRARARQEQIDDNTPTVQARKRRPRTTRARIRAETAKKLGILAARKRKREVRKSAGDGDTETEVGGGAVGRSTIQSRMARPKIRRNALNEPPKVESKFRKRQLNKTWLPTHLWHAKRATMTEPSKPLWRFAIPLTPTEKNYRPTHRASGQNGTLFWDTSYMSTIGLYGLAGCVERVLRDLGLSQEGFWGPRGQKWRTGLRKWTGLLSKQRDDIRRDIGPATIIWNPEIPTEHPEEAESVRPKKSHRQLFIRTHPSCFLELFNELLALAKTQAPQLHVEDLRFEIGSIELIGPGSTETLLGVLKPYYETPKTQEPQARLFRSLGGVTNPSSLPKDALLAFSTRDPRLSYPPKRVEVWNGGLVASLLDILTAWPVEEGLKPFGLFSRDTRYQGSRLPPMKSINRRKGSSAPREPIPAMVTDPPIPIILFTSRSRTDGQAQGTWTLLAPWKCILPIWYSVVHYPLSTGGNPRLGGLDEVRQVAFENGVPWFPGDFPGTDAGAKWELEQRARRKRDWDRRPKGKRVEWKSLDLGAGRKSEIGDGLACDFEQLFGLPKTSLDDQPEVLEEPSNAVPGKATTSAPPLAMVKQMSKASFAAFTTPSNSDNPPAHSIITANLTFVARGIASDCARIYRLPTRAAVVVRPSTQTEVPSTEPPSTGPRRLPSNLREQWLQKDPLGPASSNGRQSKKQPAPPRIPKGADAGTRKKLLTASLVATELPYPRPAANQSDVGGHPLCPNENDLIGFVTTGAFSLSEGKGTAIGSISAEKALEMLRGPGAREGRYCIVRNAGESVGWLARWEAV
ncbi:ribonucleases P/MRP protein subunit POP1-domain-containing protein [Podospora didyma]|uniref:Ribonucleases P/MRP protein subunit POP1-domain-containing protein n=1 Tax=Podospora didyma TaxID=330526 RepID=A0AAE0P5Y9_9PEZI|nr:ribonucleases P/MRP protein subunit POP1-domain-containing protein [Podospora didyma]